MDVVRAQIFLAENNNLYSGQVFNITSENVSFKQLFIYMAAMGTIEILYALIQRINAFEMIIIISNSFPLIFFFFLFYIDV